MRAAALLLFACAHAVAGPRASVELLPIAQVSAAQPVLGQLARIRGEDLSLVRQLVRWPVPVSSGTVLSRAELLAATTRSLGLGETEVEWTGSELARIARMAERIDGDLIAHAAAGALSQHMASVGTSGEVRVRHRPRDIELAGSGATLQVRPLDALPLRRTMVAWVDVVSAERVLRSVPVSLEITSVLEPTPASNQLAPTPARAKDLLSVSRGDWATLRASAGPIALESRVEVLQDGRAGDRIRVRQPGGAGMVFARVLGTGLLELVP